MTVKQSPQRPGKARVLIVLNKENATATQTYLVFLAEHWDDDVGIICQKPAAFPKSNERYYLIDSVAVVE